MSQDFESVHSKKFNKCPPQTKYGLACGVAELYINHLTCSSNHPRIQQFFVLIFLSLRSCEFLSDKLPGSCRDLSTTYISAFKVTLRRIYILISFNHANMHLCCQNMINIRSTGNESLSLLPV